ncbi:MULTISPECIES: class 1 fructose-bisphosphatase [unclassified Oceanobacter]|jgi:fructose-1,6-bisphosphatase I|uniref:class 1 fructose-bisphosphatase n=1 Tax=unclassified Oceanobacter TaxID=2620260 RepID=UPI0026E34F20|nr:MULTISPECIES: class 1 fructose-bisphosphatase [unclassified Oceanobacter]MDO6681624.1 class 1 fructose-bisphosphatase [Oceanobacter sp. 5_MG-2023]MDP2505748.1 class 1 fructose-bisphosphatase [Oceanobacter sp. 3_MG-2023]MDP2547425.1 class 1 fructose-bisphosphatase [Oceanobacter sp. 4_MG-2023]MDP2608213.1 class 1 fructose-bisphosphatase [Oceanobacter sp. 1_MG-2023]MDP2612939.1 class 1 fructose-bisphosphatase [Oceanobacter sp. 2_MG-2023]
MLRLRTFLQQHCDQAELIDVIDQLAVTCKDIAHQLTLGELAGILGSAEQENVQGECQKKLDVIANDLLKDSLAEVPAVRGIASEEEPDPVACNDDGSYLVLFDPLDGSSNIDINVTVGTIFSILKAPEGTLGGDEAAYLQPGNQQVAAGYVLYGPSTIMMLTIGHGVYSFTLDTRMGEFLLMKENIQVPEETAEFAINMSNQRFWDPAMQQYVDDLLKGETGPLGKRYNMRWVAAMVAEIHRILTRGGIFMYPFDNRDPGKPGKLRLMYEANPMSMLMEQAGGRCSTASDAIMSIQPEGIHQRVPVVMGSAAEVTIVEQYHQ